MKKSSFLLIMMLVMLLLPAHAQRVGLVLSGGGAKGMTHIGIIRALEENGIPIDYITGTSMGAIIGSLYAMGYSPDEMEDLLRSPDFKRWYTGVVEPRYAYYFKQNLPTPEFFNLRFSLGSRDSTRVKPQLSIPTSVVNPIQMNLAFVGLYGQATAACGGDFNDLFVPFRCVASDVYNKRPVVMRQGDLGDAVRASMSFPFVFKPIEMDSVLVYDGGIYNNFPTDVMRDDFHPDVIIGSVVAGNPKKPQEGKKQNAPSSNNNNNANNGNAAPKPQKGNNNRPKQKPKAAAPEKQVNGEKQPNTDKQQPQAKQPANNKPANRPQQANNNKPKNAKKDNQ